MQEGNEVSSRVDNSETLLKRARERDAAVVPVSVEVPVANNRDPEPIEKPKVSRALEPFGDRILILQKAPEDFYQSGDLKLVKLDEAKERPNEGTVVARGPGRRLENGIVITPNVEPGDVVIFGRYAGTEQELNGVVYLIVREDEILGRIVETPI